MSFDKIIRNIPTDRLIGHDIWIVSLRQGSNERDSSSPTERVSPVILSEAKDLSAERERLQL